MTINARAIQPQDIEGAVLRPADLEECLGSGLSAADAIRLSVESSIYSCAIEVEGEVAAFFGYGSETWMSEVCFAWLLTTPICDKYRLKFARLSQNVLRELCKQFKTVIVSVDERHMEAKNWLRWLGFDELARYPGKTTEFVQMIKRR